ncbi:hypothetical protein [Paraburkholderia caballeronis]|uniref:hypothetical protein n=1 Tax=Paraburkholderia caballeronis TaxID=416943 RepID=UPI0010651441|nr:hypothetical protein [Paraburkholderia caballeronis]TDV06768.1 hypothetical protein C7408_12227 [Paraburkholderia caballeronis]TDV09948.1 hypothetical protein C7406_12427 [Paraburkholderia caballeronis]TDV21780.1 hypothetical protein C7404_12027 [Paraburkholderia caballeronis]
MVRIACSLSVASLVLVATVAAAAAQPPHPASDLAHAQQLVGQSRRLVRDAHRQSPDGFGGHEAKAEKLLRRASVELNAAHDFASYNTVKTPPRPHAVKHRKRRRIVRVAQHVEPASQ